MKNVFELKYIWLLAVVCMTSCKNSEEKQDKEKPQLHSGVIAKNMDTSVNPGDDFTAYVNGAWMKRTEIPADKAGYSAGYIVHEKAEENVKTIIEESAKGDFEQGTSEQKVGDLYSSYMNMSKRNELGLSPLQDDMAKIDAITNYDELATYFAYANKLGMSVPMSSLIIPDLKNPEVYAAYLFQDGLGLPEREYYLAQDARSKEIRSAYQEFMVSVITLAEIENPEAVANQIIQLETRIAEKHMKKEDTRDVTKLYNMYAIDKLPEIMPDFNWNNYVTEAGLNELEQIDIAMVDYTKALNNIIKTTALSVWKNYLKWGLITARATVLTKELDDLNFNFYRKELNGVEEQRPMWTRGVATVNNNLGEVVGKVYVKKHFPPEAKERMEEMVANLIKAYEKSIKALDWMGEETKAEALDKLSKFNPKIGYPDTWKDYSALVIKEDDLYGNINRSALVQYQREIDKIGQPIDKEEWGMTPQTVNAYYNPTMNEIVFPAGILQPPFFDLNAEEAVNYGAIGAIIGHEIGHGFDDSGSAFDGDGMMRDWWTPADKEEFKKRTEALIEQYNQFEVIDSVFVNGRFTLGENIGDLGGLSIALQAYKMSLDGEEAPEMDGFTAEQRVFIGYAQAWLSKARDEALRMQVTTDEHSPARFRVNGVVRNVPEFYSAFNVKPDNELYLAPKERVKIW